MRKALSTLIEKVDSGYTLSEDEYKFLMDYIVDELGRISQCAVTAEGLDEQFLKAEADILHGVLKVIDLKMKMINTAS